MKTNLFFLLAVLALAGCSSQQEPIPQFQNGDDEQQANPSFVRPLDQALSIGRQCIGSSRSGEEFDVSYIVEPQLSRSRVSNDTIAYILNRPGGGFAVIAYDTRVASLLAYSDTGQFSYQEDEKDPVYSMFVGRLIPYVDSLVQVRPANENVPQAFDSLSNVIPCQEQVLPAIKVTITEDAPFDTYVSADHPGCKVGCVAVATGQIMLYCKDYLSNYHSHYYSLDQMRLALNPNVDPEVYYPYTTAQAQDDMALLLYRISQDVNTVYDPSGSIGDSNDAFLLFQNRRFSIRESGLTTYNDIAAASSVIDGYLVYISGSKLNLEGIHAWMIDGCSYRILQIANSQAPISSGIVMRAIDNVFVHCNWGWGSCNGYYRGDVFNVRGETYTDCTYFSVLRECE